MERVGVGEVEVKHSAARREASVPGPDRRAEIAVDCYRQIVFPNRLREMRHRHASLSLLQFAALIPQISYIRLSKIERGEVYPRADELVRIAGALGIAPRALLIDIDAPTFDMDAWFAPFAEGAASDDEHEARFALLLAAAIRARRSADATLTAATLDARYGIPPVILSRLENALKGLSRWNSQTVTALCALFDTPDAAALRAHVGALHDQGALDPFLAAIPGAPQRRARTRQRIAALEAELADVRPVALAASDRPDAPAAPRQIPAYGAPLGAGRIAKTRCGSVDAPALAGPRAFAVRTGAATLGGGLPGQATVIVDPDRHPQPGGLALVRETDEAGIESYRLLSVAVDRSGLLQGYSLNPAHEVALDPLPPGDVAAVVAAYFA